MDFKIVYYRDNSGKIPVEEFLVGLKSSNSPLVGQALRGIEKLRNKAYHREPLSKYLEPGLWELRVKAGNNILRILYTFAKGRTIYLLHVFIKKKQKTPAAELEIARKRLGKLKEKKGLQHE